MQGGFQKLGGKGSKWGGSRSGGIYVYLQMIHYGVQ